ncbi:uncharacterized protein ARMOST_02374 [Armillaria ostoyae]|uniref:Uncharacterized protein n=1 Tax=Armillaria ostoyae TaxID=47428 RepID=A0A284QRI4_ARMOS|nr:uncharacterized protein ARMOST_02374 [Armillaria ostoyae]
MVVGKRIVRGSTATSIATVFTAVKPYNATGFTGHSRTVNRTVNQESEGLTVRVRSRIYGTRIRRIYGDVMIATVVFGFRQRNEIFVVPIGTVFAFTQLRFTMPGAPEGFDNPGDILDFAGLLPCLILLSISAVSMVGIYLFVNPDDPSRRSLTWSELENVLHPYIQHVWITAEEWVRRVRFRIMIAKQIMKPPYNVEIPLTDTAHENPA